MESRKVRHQQEKEDYENPLDRPWVKAFRKWYRIGAVIIIVAFIAVYLWQHYDYIMHKLGISSPDITVIDVPSTPDQSPGDTVLRSTDSSDAADSDIGSDQSPQTNQPDNQTGASSGTVSPGEPVAPSDQTDGGAGSGKKVTDSSAGTETADSAANSTDSSAATETANTATATSQAGTTATTVATSQTGSAGTAAATSPSGAASTSASTSAPDQALLRMAPGIARFYMHDLQHGIELVKRADNKFYILETSDSGRTFTRQTVAAQSTADGTSDQDELVTPVSTNPTSDSASPSEPFSWQIPSKPSADIATNFQNEVNAAKTNFATYFDQPDKELVKKLSQQQDVFQVQFVGENIGWALVSGWNTAQLQITIDGGKTFIDPTDPKVTAAISKEQKRLSAVAKERKYFQNNPDVDKILKADWYLLPHTVNPGDVLLVRHNKPGQVTFDGKTYTLEPFDTGYYTYLPVPILTKPGTYKVGDLTLTVNKKDFPTDRLTVSKQLASIEQNTKRIQEDQKVIDKGRSHTVENFLFPADSKFMIPTKGRISTPFGYTRYVNGEYDGSHTAIDIAAPTGTKVKATNDGIVVIAQNFYQIGNSIYIDHGMDLFSQYIHMSKLLVKVGDKVKKGQVIGLVGQTGFATGPNLHFTFWAHNVPVNPNLFFDKTPFDW